MATPIDLDDRDGENEDVGVKYWTELLLSSIIRKEPQLFCLSWMKSCRGCRRPTRTGAIERPE